MAEKIIRVQNCGECPNYELKCQYDGNYGHFCMAGAEQADCYDPSPNFKDCPLEDAPRWRKYPDEKPKHNQRIIVNNHGTYQLLICDDCYYDLYSFNYWMPIPEIGE